MSKRFTDTNKYKKSFFRGLPGPYKLFWDFLYHDCDHAGIWHVDMDIAQIYLGVDMAVDKDTAIKLFNQGEERVRVLNGGTKWFIVPFVTFQYGTLNPLNRLHASVLQRLHGEKIKALPSPLLEAKDKDKDKDKNKDKAFEQKKKETFFHDTFWSTYPKREAKKDAFQAWLKIDTELYDKIIAAIQAQKVSENWTKEKGKYIPLAATWLNGRRWEDETTTGEKKWNEK